MNDYLLVLEAIPSRLLAVPLDGADPRVLIDDLSGTPDGVAIDYRRKHIYWTNMGDDWSKPDGFIERINFDGSGRTVVIPPGATFTPKQIQVDADAGLIYWCDREGMRVMRARVDGSDVTVLVETGCSEVERADARRHCVGIAIDPIGKRLYWTQKGPPKGDQGAIYRAPIDLPEGMSPALRSDIEVLFDHLPEPIDLEWDRGNNALYWTDRGAAPRGNTLNRCQFEEGRPGPPELLLGSLKEGIGLALDHVHDRAFVSDLGGFIRATSLNGLHETSTFRSGLGPLTGIALWSSNAE